MLGAVGQNDARQDERLGFDAARVAEDGYGGDASDASGFDVGLGEEGFLLVPSGAVVIPCAGEERRHSGLRERGGGEGEKGEQSYVGLHGSSRGVVDDPVWRILLCWVWNGTWGVKIFHGNTGRFAIPESRGDLYETMRRASVSREPDPSSDCPHSTPQPSGSVSFWRTLSAKSRHPIGA